MESVWRGIPIFEKLWRVGDGNPIFENCVGRESHGDFLNSDFGILDSAANAQL